jgi:hypothetical protein
MCPPMGTPSLPNRPPNVTNYKVTNPDYALGYLRYSIRARAIP